MSAWEDTLAAAVVGTARQPARPTLPTPLESLLAPLPASPESALLAQAAVLAVCRLAGARPMHPALTPVNPAADETRSACGDRAGAVLAALVRHGEDRELLREWLELADRRQLRIPEELLPELLALGRQDTELRARLAPVVGERGRWLARCNPDWLYLLAQASGIQDAHQAWQTGSANERLGILRQLRGQSPELARDLLTSTWKDDPADARAKFIEALAVGLSMADEPFLEAALDDRSIEVRQRAADLLARLPASARCARMASATQALLDYRSGWLGGKLQVVLPESYESAWKRDGIRKEPLAQRKDMGERAWWLLQLLSAVPTTVWRERWKIDAKKHLELAAGDWRELLLEAWFTAASRTGDWEFLSEYLPVLLGSKDAERHGDRIAACVATLSAERAQELAAEALDHDGVRVGESRASAHLLRALLAAHPRQGWCERLASAYARTVLTAIRERRTDAVGFLRALMPASLACLPLATGQQLLAGLLQLPSESADPRDAFVERTREQFVHHLERRQDIHAAFASSTGDSR